MTKKRIFRDHFFYGKYVPLHKICARTGCASAKSKLSLRDLEEGRVYKYDSLDDLIKEIEG